METPEGVKLPAEIRGADRDLREINDTLEDSVRDEIRLLHDYVKVQFSVQSGQLQELITQLKGALSERYRSRELERASNDAAQPETSIDFSRLDKLMAMHGLDLQFETDAAASAPNDLAAVGQLLEEHGINLASEPPKKSRFVKSEDSVAQVGAVNDPARNSGSQSVLSIPTLQHLEHHSEGSGSHGDQAVAPKRDSSRYSFVRSKLNAQTEIARQAASQVARSTAQNRQEEEIKTTRDIIRQMVSSNLFVYGVMGLIFVNLLMLGIEVEISIPLGQDEIPTWFETVNLVIVGVFVVEIILKFIGFGLKEFFCGADGHWNIFDLVIILLSVMETVLDFWAASQSSSQVELSHLRVMRFMRLARTLRGIRVIRLLRYVSALRTLVFSILNTMKSLLWTLVLLCLQLTRTSH